MNSKWIINLEKFKDYRFGEDKNLYRLKYIDARKCYRSSRLIKLVKNRYIFFLMGKKEAWSLTQLRPHIVIDERPIKI